MRNLTNMTGCNQTNNATYSDPFFSKYVVFLMPVLLGGFVGNALVILAFFKGPRKIRTFTNYFVVNLAVSDLMVGCLSLPLWILMNLGFADNQFNKYMVPLDIFFGVTSIYSLVLISLERLFAVKYPTKHFNLHRYKVNIAVGFIWVLGILLFIAEAVIIQMDKATDQVWVTILVFITFAIPVSTITVSYVILYVTASNLMKGENKTVTLTREIKVAKTIMVIISLFCVCWAPFFMVNLLNAYRVLSGGSHANIIAIHVTKALHYLNSMMNFFVYAVRVPDFRITFKQLICSCGCKWRQRALTFISIKQESIDNPSRSVITQHSLLKNELTTSFTDTLMSNSNGSCRLSSVTTTTTADLVLTEDEVILSYN